MAAKKRPSEDDGDAEIVRLACEKAHTKTDVVERARFYKLMMRGLLAEALEHDANGPSTSRSASIAGLAGARVVGR
jgi:hypothetical protein